MWYQGVKLADILVENSDLGRELLEAKGAANILISFPFLKKSLWKPCSATSDKEKSDLVHAGALAGEDAPRAEKRANKRFSRLVALERLSAFLTTRPPWLAQAGVIIIDDMFSNGKYLEDAFEIEAGMMPHGSDELIVS